MSGGANPDVNGWMNPTLLTMGNSSAPANNDYPYSAAQVAVSPSLYMYNSSVNYDDQEAPQQEVIPFFSAFQNRIRTIVCSRF